MLVFLFCFSIHTSLIHVYKSWQQQTYPAICSVWNPAIYDKLSAVQAPWGSSMTLIAKKLQQKQCLWLCSSGVFFLIIPSESHFPHHYAFVISSECTTTIRDTNIWLLTMRPACHSHQPIFILWALLHCYCKMTHCPCPRFNTAEGSLWKLSNIRFDSNGICSVK